MSQGVHSGLIRFQVAANKVLGCASEFVNPGHGAVFESKGVYIEMRVGDKFPFRANAMCYFDCWGASPKIVDNLEDLEENVQR